MTTMTTELVRHYVAADGAYLGAAAAAVRHHPAVHDAAGAVIAEAWDEEVWPAPPDGGVEVPTPPGDARQVWDFDTATWGPPPRDILAEIEALERQQTPRRIREAALTDAGRRWLESLDAQIAALRAELS